ncbi:MAG: SMC-Scp complex subunit ScpB [Bdellovibrionaceae bacterium]|nr:SMC-Scp complex subunit ScpB [Pseudobdellovibrionaceae bacterium]
MAEIEKDPKDLDATAADDNGSDLSPEETVARSALKDLVRSAGNALNGWLEDESATAETPTATCAEESTQAVIEESSPQESGREPEMAQIEWRMSDGEFVEDEQGGPESVEELEARAQAEAEAEAAEAAAAAAAIEDLSEEESQLADEELGPAEFIEADRMQSIIESLLFTSERPVSLATIKTIFKGSNIRTRDITRCLDQLASEYAASRRGVALEEINGGYQLRTKVDNAEYLKRLSKTRPFRLSGPALETMSIIAYKQPLSKHEVDEIRGVESGHLVRALMERGLVCFQGKSEGPGKPMLYGTTRKFLEIFGLRNIKELPTLAEIDELLPEGIGEEAEVEKPKLADLTDQMSETVRSSYSEGEEELQKITDSLTQIDTSSEFFEQEKIRQRDKRDSERAANIREAMAVGEAVEDKDVKWLKRYEAKLAEPAVPEAVAPDATADADAAASEEFRQDIESLSQGMSTRAAQGDEDADAEMDAEMDSVLSEDADWDESLGGNLDETRDGDVESDDFKS